MTTLLPDPPLDWPHYGIGFFSAIKRGFQKYATFTGRASRSEFWWWALGNFLVLVVLYGLLIGLGLATSGTSNDFGPGGIAPLALLIVWLLATIVPNIAITVRRLHDAGYSGWFYLFNIVGLGIVTTVLCILPTSPNAPRYGPPAPAGYGPGYQPQQGFLPPDPYAQQPHHGQQHGEQPPQQPGS